jgi:hypothetical protein
MDGRLRSSPTGVKANVVPEGSVSVVQPDEESWKSSEKTTEPLLAVTIVDSVTGVEGVELRFAAPSRRATAPTAIDRS